MSISNKGVPEGLPVRAAHPVTCERGGKHAPTTRELKLSVGSHVKYKVCTKCHKLLD